MTPTCLGRGVATTIAVALHLVAMSGASAQLTPEALDRIVRNGLDMWNVAGAAVAVVSEDRVVLAGGWGVRDVRTGDPVTPRTVFAIGSNTKLMTAVAAGMMVDDGRMGWDDRATRHLPNFHLHDPWVSAEIRIRDLLSHRSGLGRRGDMLWYASPHDRAEILRRIRFLEPNTSFRSTYGYQNVMFLAAGEAVAAAAGRSWDDVIRERIFAPLEMETATTSTRDLAKAGSPWVTDVATPHLNTPVPDSGPTVSTNVEITTATEDAPATGEWSDVRDGPRAVAWRTIDNVAPAGSVNASVEDMAKWLRFLLGNGTFEGRELLDSATLREITSPQTIRPFVPDTLLPTTHFSTYGLGVGIRDQEGVKVLVHTGGIDGMLSTVAFVPERDFGVVVLTNTAGRTQLHVTIAYEILDAWLGGPDVDWNAALLERTERAEAQMAEVRRAAEAAVPRGTQPSLPVAAYAGTYRSVLYGDLVVRADGDRLDTAFGPNLTGSLEHAYLDTFRVQWTGPAAGESLLTFHLDVRGRVGEVEAEGIGTFARVDMGGAR